MGFLLNALGMQNNYQSNLQAPPSSLYQLPGMQQSQQSLAQQLAQSQQAQAPTAQAAQSAGTNLNLGQYNQTNNAQNSLAGQLMNTANGGGVSPADLQLQQGLQQQLAQQRAAAVSAGANGANPLLAQRQLAQQAASAGQNTNAALAQQRASETQAAQNSLGSLLSNQANTNLNAANSQAQLAQNNQQFNASNAQQAGLANQQANLQQQGINSQNAQFYNTAMQNNNNTQLQANIANANNQLQAATTNDQINAGVAQQNTQAAGSLFGSVLGGATSALKFSDERLKTKVKRDVDDDMAKFLKGLDSASYEYKNPALGSGRQWSPMAQSAAKSDVGRSFVVETPTGLALDTTKGFGVALSALKHLSDKQDQLEKIIVRGKRG